MTERAAVATVIVVNWNGRALLPECLDALAGQRLADPFLVWVVDNGSTDGSVELLERDYPQVRLLRNAANLGFAGGNNRALREVSTPYAVLLNNDAAPEADWLARLLEGFAVPGGERVAAVTSKVLFAPRFLPLRLCAPPARLGSHDPRTVGLRLSAVTADGEDVTAGVLMERLTWAPEGRGGDRFRWTRPEGDLLVPLPEPCREPLTLALRCAAPRPGTAELRWPGGRADLPVGPVPAEHAVVVADPAAGAVTAVNNAGSVVTADGHGVDRGYQEVDRGQYDEAVEVFALCGAAVALRTEAGRAAGWFDEDFFLYYEDTDLSWRLRALGWTVRYEPRAVVRHRHAASSVEWSAVYSFHTERNRLLMLVKNASAPRMARALARYPLTTTSLAVRAVREGRRRGVRPDLRPAVLRLRVMASLLRLAPRLLARRRALARAAVVGRRELERWLVSPGSG